MLMQPDRQILLRRFALPLAVWLIAHALLVLPVPGWVQGGAALTLLLFPGALLALLLFNDQHDLLTRCWLALSGGLALLPPLILGLHALPGAFPAAALLVACDALTVLHGALLLRQGDKGSGEQGDKKKAYQLVILSSCHLVIAVIVLGSAFRLPYLGTSEMQGDETRALLMATGVLYGQDDILLLHKKGPVEVLLPAGPLALTGVISEGVARLPFALAGLGVLLGALVLGRQALTPQSLLPSQWERGLGGKGLPYGLLAAFILALDGFLIGFARIVQYQSIVVLLGAAAVWCAWQFAAGAVQWRRYLIAAAWCWAVALLAHWDAVFALPALAWLVVAGVRGRGWSVGAAVQRLALPTLVGSGLVTSFFVPFVAGERFQATIGYLDSRLQTEGENVFPFNNLLGYWRIATFYNTTFQIGALAAVLLGGSVAWLWRYVRPRWLGGALAALLLVGSALLVVAPDALVLASGASWALVPLGVPLLALIVAPATPFVLRTLLIWFGTTFIVESFLVSNPRTHFYSMNVPAALLVALVVVQWMQATGNWQPAARRRAVAVTYYLLPVSLLLPFALSVPYLYIAFVRQSPPYALTFPEARPALYRASYGDDVPEGGAFGFPHRSGWKVIGALYGQGVLQGSYQSNEEEIITGWYLRGAYRCADTPDYYFVAETPNDPMKLSRKKYEQYNLFGSVLVNGAPEMRIYSREPVKQPRTFDADSYNRLFDVEPVANFPLLRALNELVPQYRSDASWQDELRLRGYDLSRAQLAPGQTATISLYWQVVQPLEGDYRVVLQVVDAVGTPIENAARTFCGVMPPQDWDPGEVNDSTFRIAADALTPGTYTLEAGLRERTTGAWLPLANGQKLLTLREITVTR